MSHVLFDRRDPKSTLQKLCEQAKFDKETITGHTGSQNGFHIMVRRLTQGKLRILRLCSGLLRLAQALLRLCSGMLTLGSGMLTLSSG
jgi:hypothetical protein